MSRTYTACHGVVSGLVLGILISLVVMNALPVIVGGLLIALFLFIAVTSIDTYIKKHYG